MRVAECFDLGLDQPALDFVNVDVVKDAPLFVDPRALRLLPTPWGNECVSLIQDFFGEVLDLIGDGKRDEAVALLEQLREPNETHLGLSMGTSRGRALGPESAVLIHDALAQSEAVKTKLIQDLEETALMVEGIGFDIISDITTNIIRGPLIEYTQQQADLLGIPMQAQDSGPMWDPAGRWFNELQDLPRAGGRKLLLVPKGIVRAKLHYNADDYFTNYVLNFLHDREMSQTNSSLVHLLKDGRPKIYKKSLKEKYGEGKRTATRITLENPEILGEYRKGRGKKPPTPYSQEELVEKTGEAAVIDWAKLIADVKAVKPGNAGATRFHKAAQALLTAVLYPWLTMPVREAEIHEGRKRIDIVYTNQAKEGFFDWFADHQPSMTVPVECKNYGSDLKNPELDQLAGRFSPRRGMLGLLVCRSFEDKDLFMQRCRDTAVDGRGFIIPLDDDDLAHLVERRRNEDFAAISRLFRERHDFLVS